jgi:hypothetical protein
VSLLAEYESDTEHVVEPLRQKVSALGSVPTAKQPEVNAVRARADLRWLVAAAAALFLALDALWLTRRGARVTARLTRRV